MAENIINDTTFRWTKIFCKCYIAIEFDYAEMYRIQDEQNFEMAMKTFICSAFLISCAASAFSQNVSDNDPTAFANALSILSDPSNKLDSHLLEATLTLALEKKCRGPFPDQSGNYYVCVFTTVRRQDQLFQFVGFESASRHPEPDLGGTVTWNVDAKRMCLTRDKLAKTFHHPPTFPRLPSYPEIRPSNPAPSIINTYDLVLHEFQPKKENTFIAIYEENKCAVKIKLYKNE